MNKKSSMQHMMLEVKLWPNNVQVETTINHVFCPFYPLGVIWIQDSSWPMVWPVQSASGEAEQYQGGFLIFDIFVL